jgi:hypothetical protein
MLDLRTGGGSCSALQWCNNNNALARRLKTSNNEKCLARVHACVHAAVPFLKVCPVYAMFLQATVMQSLISFGRSAAGRA